MPTVEGPLPVTAESYPFGAAAHQRAPEDLSQTGYVEEEFLVSGRANVYDWSETGPGVVRTPDAPYTTRVLVRRPQRRSTKVSSSASSRWAIPSPWGTTSRTSCTRRS